MALLEVHDLHVAYGKIEAVKGISFSVEQGQIVTLIGTNGAGKTTTLRTISGLLRPAAGWITFDGKAIQNTPAHQIVELGLAHSPEGRHIFPRMTIEENLLLGAYLRKDSPGITDDVSKAYAMFPILGERRAQAAGTLSGGEQQMLAMARALTTDPSLLLLDEISMGLAPLIVAELYDLVGQLASEGISILLVEQFARTALAIADYAAIMVHGQITRVGQPQDVTDEVSAAYLGSGAAD